MTPPKDKKNKEKDDTLDKEIKEVGLLTAKIALEKAELDLKEAKLKFDLEVSQKYYQHFTYDFFESISKESVKKAINETTVLVRQMQPEDDLRIFINSPGGECHWGFALYDHLRDLGVNNKIRTYVRGEACSMASILLQAGDERIMGEYSWLMIHELSSVAQGNFRSIEDEASYLKRYWNKFLEIYAKRSHLSTEEIEKRCYRKDWWLCAGEALELGFIDRIG